jgi:hypothetical protein
MSENSALSQRPTTEEVSKQFEARRRTIKLHDPIPMELWKWKAAASPCGPHRPYIVGRKFPVRATGCPNGCPTPIRFGITRMDIPLQDPLSAQS